MKKTLLATAIISGLVSATAGAATVYDNDGTSMKIGGRAEVRGVFGDGVEGTMEDKSRARINFDAKTQISENLTGFGFVEYQLDGKDDLTNRYLYAGFGTQVGDFSYGRQDTAGVQISDFTDIASNHSGEQQLIDAASDKRANTFLYSGEFADGLTVQASYIAEEDKDADSFGISAAYEFDFGLNIGAAYSDADNDSNQATFGAGYTLNDFYVAATYAMGDVDANDDFTGLEVAAQYKFTKEFRLIGIYANVETDSDDLKEKDYFALEAQYRFNSSIRTYASYMLDNMDDGEDELMVGLRYNF
ncbi:membrane protein [Psychromonas marina]|uniref:Membrane protein n=1 Tax=Psychromonas marina TaxID=88364 RepID=A0ABQ6DZC4_9GAMM|nr:porin [Psychromonas marina]GLS90407.1 membrane protein [Psychromonas marina]